MRTASLLPSATEVVGAMGAESALVARSHRCNVPQNISSLPVVTRSRIPDSRDADIVDIDSLVDSHQHGSGSPFEVITSVLAATDPELILTQSLCEVCAVPESMTREVLDQLDTSPELLAVRPATIDEMFDSIEQIGNAMGYDGKAASLINTLSRRITTIESCIPEETVPPRVVCLEWIDPLRYHGLWIPDILEHLQTSDPFGSPGNPGDRVEWDSILDYDPELLVVSPCGCTVAEIESQMSRLADKPGWETLSAVQQNQVYILDGELSSRHGPRIVRCLELLASLIYPNHVPSQSPSATELKQY